MKTYPNQMCVFIERENIPPGSFTTIRNDSLMLAATSLAPGTLKLFLYLCTISPGAKWYLSAAVAKKTLGISASTYARAVKELKEKGYLTKNETGSFKLRKSPHHCKDE